jgi:hypothetical protein
MAILVPSTLPEWRPGAFAERSLFEALRTGLPDDFHVFHDYGYLGGPRPAEGAVDFLVAHRELGLLAIECKGPGVRARGDGTWTRLLEDGREEPLHESPFRQAQRHVKELVAILAPKVERLFPQLGGAFPFTHGHAVAFPKARYDRAAHRPADAPPEIVLDCDDLARLGERVPAILEFWGRGRPPHPVLDDLQYRSFRKNVLYPRWKCAPTFGARLELESQAIVRLSAEQAEVLRSVVAGPRLCVRGGAGSGKTLLALELARTRATEGRSVLVVCFTVSLSRWIAETAAAWGLRPGSVQAATFHDLCREAADALGDLPPEPAGGDRAATDAYWQRALPERLLAATAADLMRRYDAVIVDEGQDLRAGWADLLEGCLRDPAHGTFVVFHDPAQDIFGTGCPVPAFPCVPLGVNFRNTRRITEYLRALVPDGPLPLSRSPEGEPPVTHRQPRGQAGVRAVARLLEELVAAKGVPPGRICILTPHKKENSALAGVDALAGLPLAADPLNREGAILCTTIGKFKGLESDVVILIDVRRGDLFCGPAYLYTAASRARVLLHVFELEE